MSRTFELLSWPILLAIGVIVYAVTKNVFLGALLCSLRAGWPVVQSWRVIRAVDRLPRRRRVLFLFYCATACWRTAASALISILVFILFDKALGHKVDFDHITATLLVLFGGIVFNTVIGLAGVICAVASGQRVWVNPTLFKMVKRWARTRDEAEFARPRFNYVIFTIGTAVSLPSLIPGLVLLSFVGQAGQALYVNLGFVLLLLGFPIAIASYFYLSHRIVAWTPNDCWPEGFFSARAEGYGA